MWVCTEEPAYLFAKLVEHMQEKRNDKNANYRQNLKLFFFILLLFFLFQNIV